MEGREFFWYRLRNCCYGIFFRGNLSERNLCTRDKNVEMKEGHSCAQKSRQAECDKLGKRIRRNLCGTGRYTKAKDRKWCAKGRLSWHRIISRPFAGEKGFGVIGKCKYIEEGAAVGIPPLRLLFRCFLWRYHAYLLISSSVIPGCSAMLMPLAMMFARRSTTASTSFGVTNRLPVYGRRISAII